MGLSHLLVFELGNAGQITEFPTDSNW